MLRSYFKFTGIFQNFILYIRYLLKSKIQRKDCFILAKPTYNYVSLDHKIFQILLWHNITFFLQKETFTIHSFLTNSHFTTNLVIMPAQWRPDRRVCPFNLLKFYAAPVLAECLTTLRGWQPPTMELCIKPQYDSHTSHPCKIAAVSRTLTNRGRTDNSAR